MSNKKKYRLNRGDRLTLLVNGDIKKVEIVKSTLITTQHGFEPLSISDSLCKTLEIRFHEALFKAIRYKKDLIKIKEITRS